MTRKLTLLAVAGGALLALTVATAPAHAAPTTGQAKQLVQRGATDVVPFSCNGWTLTVFGYTGCFKTATAVIPCDWDDNGTDDEYFGIAPDRTIWHAWPGSGAWREMPNNGRADDTWNCYWNGNGQRQVEVKVNGVGIYYSYYAGANVWKGWYRY